MLHLRTNILRLDAFAVLWALLFAGPSVFAGGSSDDGDPSLSIRQYLPAEPVELTMEQRQALERYERLFATPVDPSSSLGRRNTLNLDLSGSNLVEENAQESIYGPVAEPDNKRRHHSSVYDDTSIPGLDQSGAGGLAVNDSTRVKFRPLYFDDMKRFGKQDFRIEVYIGF